LDSRAWDLLDVLRLLANSFKHDPFDKPSVVLLKRLGLPENMNYGSLAESGAVRFGLCKFLGIGDDAAFSEIVDAVRKFCDRILFMLQAGTPLRPPGRTTTKNRNGSMDFTELCRNEKLRPKASTRQIAVPSSALTEYARQ